MFLQNAWVIACQIYIFKTVFRFLDLSRKNKNKLLSCHMLAVFVSSQSAACVVSGIISAYRVLAEELQSRSSQERRGDVLKFPRSFTAKTLSRARAQKKGRPADLTVSPSVIQLLHVVQYCKMKGNYRRFVRAVIDSRRKLLAEIN